MCTIICEDRLVTEQTMVAHRSHRRFHRVSHHPPARRWHRASMKCRVDSMGWETTTSTTVTTITAVQAHPLMCRTATVLTIWRHLLHVKRNRWEWFFARISISRWIHSGEITVASHAFCPPINSFICHDMIFWWIIALSCYL